jgi:hypothetical protein
MTNLSFLVAYHSISEDAKPGTSQGASLTIARALTILQGHEPSSMGGAAIRWYAWLCKTTEPFWIG